MGRCHGDSAPSAPGDTPGRDLGGNGDVAVPWRSVRGVSVLPHRSFPPELGAEVCFADVQTGKGSVCTSRWAVAVCVHIPELAEKRGGHQHSWETCLRSWVNT